MSAPHSLYSDEELVLNYKATANTSLVGELFKRHSLMCFSVCMKYLKDQEEAEDATMNIFEKLFIDLKKHEVQNFKSWLHSVCRNHCLMHLRKPDLHESLDGNSGNENLFMELHRMMHLDDSEQEKEQRLQKLELAMDSLNSKQRECLELFYYKRKSYEEIKEQTGFTILEVKSYIQNGKRNLKIQLAENGITLTMAIIAWIQHTA